MATRKKATTPRKVAVAPPKKSVTLRKKTVAPAKESVAAPKKAVTPRKKAVPPQKKVVTGKSEKKSSNESHDNDNMPVIKKKIPVIPKKSSSIFSDHEEVEKISNQLIDKFEENDDYQQLEVYWHAIVKTMETNHVKKYFEILRKMLMGRISTTESIEKHVEKFPRDMIKTHEKFFELISKVTSVYPHTFHNGDRLISKHFVGGVNEIGAVTILCCLYNGVMPLDVSINRIAITRISSLVRDQIKDCLETAASKRTTRSSFSVKSFEIPKFL